MQKSLRAVFGVVLILATVQCTRKAGLDASNPETVVREFIKLSTEAKEPGDRKGLEELCQGAMRDAFKTMSDEQFKVSYLRNHLKVKDFLLMGSEIRGDEAVLHYRVMVENTLGTDPTDEANEREVLMVRVKGRWYLELIRPKGKDQIAFTRGVIL